MKSLGCVSKCCVSAVPLPRQADSQAGSWAITCLPVPKGRKASTPTAGRRPPCWEAPWPRESMQIPAGIHTFGSSSSESRGQRVALPDRVIITVPVPATWTDHRAGRIIPTAERHKAVSHPLLFCPWLCPMFKANTNHNFIYTAWRREQQSWIHLASFQNNKS